MESSPWWPAVLPPRLIRRAPNGRSMSSWHATTRSTATPRFLAKEAIGGPHSFMKVVGVTRRRGTSRWRASAAITATIRTFFSPAPSRPHSSSTTIAPALWRVRAYRSPGLPSPATSQGSRKGQPSPPSLLIGRLPRDRPPPPPHPLRQPQLRLRRRPARAARPLRPEAPAEAPPTRPPRRRR